MNPLFTPSRQQTYTASGSFSSNQAKLSVQNKPIVPHQLVISHSPSPPKDNGSDNESDPHNHIKSTVNNNNYDDYDHNNNSNNDLNGERPPHHNYPSVTIEDCDAISGQNINDDSLSQPFQPEDSSSPIKEEHFELNNTNNKTQSKDILTISMPISDTDNDDDRAINDVRRSSIASDDMNSVISSEATSDYFSYIEPSKISAPHLTIGQYIKVKVKVLRLRNLSKDCSTVLVQFLFSQEGQEPNSSTIYQNDGNEVPMNHIHVYRIKVL